MNSIYRKTIIIVAFLIFVVISYKVFSFLLFIYTPASIKNESKIVFIKQGSSFTAVSNLLYENGLIKNKKKFYFLAKLRKAFSKIKSGEFMFNLNMNPMQIMDIIINGVPVTYSFTIPEGYNMYQIADIVVAKGIVETKEIFLEAARDKKLLKELGVPAQTVEGYLFPDTYNVPKIMKAESLIKLMNRGYKKAFTKEMLKRASQLQLSEHEVVVLASIIEKETGAPQERPVISSVFHNRIKKRMRLMSDPTTIYGIWSRFDGNLRRSDLQEYTPYNTYKIFGLPPGPIASPGLKSLEAALYPEETSYLYFVSRNDGTHYFSVDYAEHKRAVDHYQKNYANRKGKSWRDTY